MIVTGYNKNSFSNHLFWDVRKEDVDMDKHVEFIVKRVLEYGLLEDWKLIRSYYGLAKIVDVAKKMRSLEPRALAFLSCISHTPEKEFRCYINQQ